MFVCRVKLSKRDCLHNFVCFMFFQNDDKQQAQNDLPNRPVALVNLDIAKITHKTVDGEFLVLGLLHSKLFYKC